MTELTIIHSQNRRATIHFHSRTKSSKTGAKRLTWLDSTRFLSRMGIPSARDPDGRSRTCDTCCTETGWFSGGKEPGTRWLAAPWPGPECPAVACEWWGHQCPLELPPICDVVVARSFRTLLQETWTCTSQTIQSNNLKYRTNFTFFVAF